MPEILTFPTADEAYEGLAAFLVEGIIAFQEYTPDVHIALTGGTDGTQLSLSMLKLLTEQQTRGRVHLWWSDERFVEFSDDLRNDKRIADLVEEFRLGSFIECHRAPAPSNGDIAELALAWEKQVSEVDFAFAVIGVGPDGHVASLFPGVWNPADPRCVFAVTDSPKPPAARITFSFGTLADAANIAVIATGAAKNPVIAQAIAGNTELPIGAIANLEQCSMWLDDAAAASLPNQQENS